MGLFDLAAPLYSAIDGLLSFLPVYPRLLLWAVVTAILSMWLYWLCSAQDKVEAAKQRAIGARKSMAGYQGTEFDEMWPLAKESLAASGRHFLIVLGPAVLSSLPALTLIIWVSNNFSYTLPETGAMVSLQSNPEISLQGLQADPDNESGYIVSWPGADQPLSLQSANNETLLTLPLRARVPVVHKRQWWNMLIGNPNGYLPAEAAIEDINFALPPIEYLAFGPGWIRGWELSYFLLLIICSLGIKIVFKIH